MKVGVEGAAETSHLQAFSWLTPAGELFIFQLHRRLSHEEKRDRTRGKLFPLD